MKRPPSWSLLAACLVACGQGSTPDTDTTAPTVTLTSSRTTITEPGSLTLEATASDDRGVTRVVFFDGSRQIGEDATAPYTLTVSFQAQEIGTRQFGVRAFDAVGNSGSSVAVIVDVRIVPPNTFVPLGEALNIGDVPTADTAPGSLAFDANDAPIVAWAESGAENGDGGTKNVYVKRWTGSAWERLGGALDMNLRNNAQRPALTLDNFSNPVVVWQEYDSSGTSPKRAEQVYVKRWTGNGWQSLGGALNLDTTKSAEDPSIAATRGSLLVAFTESSPAHGNSASLNVKRWNAASSTWQSVGGRVNASSDRNAFTPSLAQDGAGQPFVAWREANGNDNIHIAKFDGLAWGSRFVLDAIPNSTAGEKPILAVTESGVAYVAWNEFDGTSRNVYVRQVYADASAMPILGNAPVDLIPNANAANPSLAVDGSGNVVVAWTEDSSADRSANLHVKRWSDTGKAWQRLGSSLDVDPARTVELPSIALNADLQPVVAFREEGWVYVKQFSFLL
jgi:Bacterial Ig domain